MVLNEGPIRAFGQTKWINDENFFTMDQSTKYDHLLQLVQFSGHFKITGSAIEL